MENFKILKPWIVTTQGLPYDVRSIMHYSAYAFSHNGMPTIEPVDTSILLSDLGQRQALTTLDIKHIQSLYCNGELPSVLVIERTADTMYKQWNVIGTTITNF